LGAACASLALAGALALGSGCQEKPREARERVVMGGETFWLEPALDDATRVRGLGGRESIPADEGMLFVFTRPMQLSFVMRDCLTDIDIAFLDPVGRVVAVHEMKAEAPKRPEESAQDYEMRLKQYPSRYASQIVVEVAPGTLARLQVKPGDLVELDAEGLKKRAK
jgi:uncharacterized membrane protein (UPF0127 family)